MDVLERGRAAALEFAGNVARHAAGDTTRFFARCADDMVTHLGAALAQIWTIRDESGVPELLAAAGTGPRPIEAGSPHHGGRSLVEAIAAERWPCLTSDLPSQARTDAPWVMSEGFTAFAGHPLVVDDRCVGVVAIYSRNLFHDATALALSIAAPQLALAIARDQSIRAAAESESRLRWVLEAARMGIWDEDLESGRLAWSGSLRRLPGFSYGMPASACGFLRAVHPDDQAAVERALGAAAEHGAAAGVRFRVVSSGGPSAWLDGTWRLVRTGDSARRRVGLLADITERRQLEAQFHQAQRLEAVGRLAGGIAHDFNNLLTAIVGYAELMKASLDSADGLHEDLEEILKAAHRAAALTRQLLTFSRQEVLPPRPLDLNQVIADVVRMLERLIGPDIGLQLHLDPALSPVCAEPGHIEQVLVNLAVNARDAMPDGGVLSIGTRNAGLPEDAPADAKEGRYALIEVTDSGVGMDEPTRQRIFEPFFTTKEPGRGTGLGLATVHRIVRQSRGFIRVSSAPGDGTAFRVYLPGAVGPPR